MNQVEKENIRKISLETQKEELIEINNQLRLLRKKKKAIQQYIEDENNKNIGLKGIKDRAYDLREDPEFIKTHGRRRYYWEIGNILGYCEKSISRIFNEEKKDISKR